MISPFIDGLNACGNLWEMVKSNMLAFQSLFTNMRRPMTRTLFKSLFAIEWSGQGSNKREAEEETVYAWKLFLNMVTSKCLFIF